MVGLEGGEGGGEDNPSGWKAGTLANQSRSSLRAPPARSSGGGTRTPSAHSPRALPKRLDPRIVSGNTCS